jgi:hypothetical protein
LHSKCRQREFDISTTKTHNPANLDAGYHAPALPIGYGP